MNKKFFTPVAYLALLCLCIGTGCMQKPEVKTPTKEEMVARGKYLAEIGGCHDCHTEGYSEAEGKIDPEKALKGSSIGFRGPWGTTYPTNLRSVARALSERGFVAYIKHMRAQPPMPWYNLRVLNESDIRSLYQYIKSLGDPGEGTPQALLPNEEPKTPYIPFAPPQMPKGG